MKRKMIAAVMAAAMILAGCGSLENTPAARGAGAAAGGTSAAAVSGTSGSAEAGGDSASSTDGGTSSSSDDDFVVAFMFDSYIDDGCWGKEHNRGRLAVEDEGIKTIYKESVPTTEDCEKVMQDFINQGADVIIGTSFGFMDYMDDMAKKNPDVIFLHCGGYENEDNFYNYLGRQYESRFLTGIVAGAVTKTNKLGYVAAYEMPEVIRQINAYTLGAQISNPDIEVDVSWTHTWDDASVETAAAQTLIDGGCDVLTCHETTTASLMPTENYDNVYAIGYTTDLSEQLPDSYLTSSGANWGAYYAPTCEAIKDGTWERANYWGGLKDGAVEVTKYSDKVPQEVQDTVADYEKKIIDGSYQIFAGPITGQDGSTVVADGTTLTDEDLTSMMYFVKGVNGTIEGSDSQ